MRHDFEIKDLEPRRPQDYDIYVCQTIIRCKKNKCRKAFVLKTEIPVSAMRKLTGEIRWFTEHINDFLLEITKFNHMRAEQFKSFHEGPVDLESLSQPMEDCNGVSSKG